MHGCFDGRYGGSCGCYLLVCHRSGTIRLAAANVGARPESTTGNPSYAGLEPTRQTALP